MTRVLSIPFATSTSWRGASSMKEYSLIAFTSSEMRHELCSMSVSRREISSVAPKRRITAPIAGAENFRAQTFQGLPSPPRVGQYRSHFPPIVDAVILQPRLQFRLHIAQLQRVLGLSVELHLAGFCFNHVQ